MEILYKTDALALYEKGLLGNRPRCWSVKDYFKSGYCGKVGLRTKIVAGGPWVYDIELKDVVLIIEKWRKLGIVDGQIHISEMAPHKYSTISGEVALSIRHYDLTFSYSKFPLREALKDVCEYAYGLTALLILKKYLDEASYVNLEDLFEKYPDSVVEFSCFEIGVGELGRNTIFWEVRNY